MFKLKSFEFFFIILYILGLNPFVSFNNSSVKNVSIAVYLPRLVNIFVNLLVTCGFFYQILMSSELGLSHLLLIIFNMANFIGQFESIRFNLKFQRVLLQTVYSTINYLEMHILILYPLKKFRNKFHLNFVILMIHFGSLIIKYFINTTIFRITAITDVLMIISLVLKDLQLIHIIFYIDFIKFSLQSLNKKILKHKSEQINSFCMNDQESLQLTRQIKLVYFKLWHVSYFIDSQFGWFLVACIVETMMSATYAIYRVFLYTSRSDINNTFVIIRK